MQVTAADVIESANGLLIGLGQIVENGVAIGIFLGRDGGRLEPEVQNGRTRYGHLRRDTRVRFEELEMIQHGMARKAELADDPRRAMFGLHPMELNAVIDFGDLHAVEHPEEIEMPPGPAKLAVSRNLQSDVFLLLDDLLDLAVLDLLERGRVDFAFFPFGPRFLQSGGTQQAADHVGAEGRFGPDHWQRLPRIQGGNKRQPQLSSTANVPVRIGPCPISPDRSVGCGQRARFILPSAPPSRARATSARAESGKWNRFSEKIMRPQNVSCRRLDLKRSCPDGAGRPIVGCARRSTSP